MELNSRTDDKLRERNTSRESLETLAIKSKKDVERIFKNYGIRMIGQSDVQLMLEAAKVGEVNVFEYLRSNSGEIMPKNSIGETLCHVAARNNRTKFLEYISQKNLPLDAKNGLGETPLMQAAEEGHIETVKFLCMSEGVNIQETNRFGENCLHYATREGRINVCEFLVKKAPTLCRVENKQGKTPMSYALENFHKDIIKAFEEADKELYKKSNTSNSLEQNARNIKK